MKLSGALKSKLADIAAKAGNGHVLVGFMGGATYPNGTPVASVAFWNEFGTKGRAPKGIAPHAEAVAEGERREPQLRGGSPPRPFFRNMIAAKSPEWADHLKQAFAAANGDGARALGLMGEEIQGDVEQSINELTVPPLAPSTIRRKGFAKPLIDTSLMVKSVTYKVNA